jgi:tetratricopeptide (TPR) repeat protein
MSQEGPRKPAEQAHRVTKRRTHVQWKRVLIVLVAAGLIAGGGVLLYRFQQARQGASIVAMAEELERQGKVAEAVQGLYRYEGQTKDKEVVRCLARLVDLPEMARQVYPDEVVRLNERLRALDPNGPDEDVCRRRIARAHLIYSESLEKDRRVRGTRGELGFGMDRVAMAKRVLERLDAEEYDRGRPNAQTKMLLGWAQVLDVPTSVREPERYKEPIKSFEEALGLGDVEAAGHLAMLYLDRLDEKKKAVTVLDRLVKARPQDARARFFRYQLLAQMGDDEKARVDLLEAQSLLKGERSDVRAAVDVELIRDDLRRHDYRSARERFDALAEDRRGDPRLLELELMLGLAEGRSEGTLALLRDEVLASGGTNRWAMLELINRYHQHGRLSEARPLLARLRSLVDKPDDDSVLNFLEGEQLALTDRPIEAIDRLERLTGGKFGTSAETRGYQDRLYLTLARCHIALGNREEAEQYFRQGLGQQPGSVPLRKEYAEWLARNRPEAAFQVVQDGLKLNPNDLGLKLIAADFLVRKQAALPVAKRDWAEVDRLLVELDKADPNNPGLARVRAHRQALGGDLEGALGEFEALCRRTPQEVENWRLRAQALIQMGKMAEALQVLQEAARPEAVGDKAELRLLQARLLSALNRGREARELVTRDVGRLVPSEQALAWKGLGELLLARGDIGEARDAFERSSKADPQDIQAIRWGFQLALNADDGPAVDRWLAALKDVLGTGGSSHPTYYRLAEATALIGLSDRAVAQVQLAQARQPLDRRLTHAQEATREALSKAPNMADALLLDAEVKKRLLEYDLKVGKVRAENKNAIKRERQAVIEAFDRAFQNGSPSAFPKLIDLRIEASQFDAGQFDEIDKLPPTTVLYDRDRVAAELCVRHGEKEHATHYIDRAVKAAGGTPEALAWKERLLALMGQGQLTETEVQRLVDQQPADLDRWLALVRVRARTRGAADVDAIVERAKAKVTAYPPDLVEGACRQAAGDLGRAEFAYQRALKAHPDDDTVAMHVAAFYQDTGRPALAEGPLRGVLKRRPDDRRAARALAVLLVSRARSPEDWDGAWAALGPEPDSPSASPEAAEDRFARAVLLARAPDQARREQGTKKLEDLLADVPLDGQLALGVRGELVQVLMRDQHHDRAVAVARDLVARSQTAGAYLLLIEALAASGQRDEALVQLDRLAEAVPGDPREANLRVRLLWDPAQPEASAAALEAAYLDRLAKAPKEAGILGRLVLAALEPVRAADPVSARVAAKMAEKEPGLSWMLARLVFRQDRTREALDLCQTAATKGGQLDRIEACRFAVAVASKDGDLQLRKFAETIVTGAVKADPKNLDLLMCQGMIYHVLGRYGDEMAIYRDLMEQKVESPTVLNNYAWALCEFRKDYKEALKYANLAIERFGNNAGLLDTRGVIETRLKDAEHAIKDLKEAVEAQPSPTRRFHLARAFALGGNADEARRHRDQAIKDGLKPTDLEPAEKADFDALSKL